MNDDLIEGVVDERWEEPVNKSFVEIVKTKELCFFLFAWDDLDNDEE